MGVRWLELGRLRCIHVYTKLWLSVLLTWYTRSFLAAAPERCVSPRSSAKNAHGAFLSCCRLSPLLPQLRRFDSTLTLFSTEYLAYHAPQSRINRHPRLSNTWPEPTIIIVFTTIIDKKSLYTLTAVTANQYSTLLHSTGSRDNFISYEQQCRKPISSISSHNYSTEP